MRQKLEICSKSQCNITSEIRYALTIPCIVFVREVLSIVGDARAGVSILVLKMRVYHVTFVTSPLVFNNTIPHPWSEMRVVFTAWCYRSNYRDRVTMWSGSRANMAWFFSLGEKEPGRRSGKPISRTFSLLLFPLSPLPLLNGSNVVTCNKVYCFSSAPWVQRGYLVRPRLTHARVILTY